MASRTVGGGLDSVEWERWLTGAVSGAVAAVVATLVLFSMGALELSETGLDTLGVLIMPGAVFGLVYAGVATIGRVSPLAQRPGFGVVLGLVYGILFWLTTVIGQAFSLSGLLAGLTFGVVIGVLYAISPFVD